MQGHFGFMVSGHAWFRVVYRVERRVLWLRVVSGLEFRVISDS